MIPIRRVHIIVQICIFLTLFLMLCDTYLFRVGLLGVLFSHFRLVLILHPIYLTITLLTDGYRVVSVHIWFRLHLFC